MFSITIIKEFYYNIFKLGLMTIVLILFCLFSFCSYGQSNNQDIEELKKIQENLRDSIKKIEFLITELESESFYKDMSESVLVLSARKGGKLRTSIRPSSSPLITFEENDKIVVDTKFYEDGYFKACYDTTCGYINEMWIKKNKEFNDLIELKKAKLRIARNQKIENKEKARIAKEKEFLRKYGQSTIERIKRGDYWIGMTEEMAIMSLGNPNDINSSSGIWGVHEQWVYEIGINLYFENGKLSSYQD